VMTKNFTLPLLARRAAAAFGRAPPSAWSISAPALIVTRENADAQIRRRRAARVGAASAGETFLR